jgi:hypothetical protein
MPDGRVGLVKTCDLDSSTSPIPTSYSLVAGSLESGSIEPLVTSSPLGFLRSFAPPTLTVSPEMDMAIVGAGNFLCGSIAMVDHQGLRYLPVTIREGYRSWSLDDYFLNDDRLCTGIGRADVPAWSPDGQHVMFAGSPLSIGIDGQGRLDAPWNLYLMDVQNWEPRVVLRNVLYPSQLSWSPDGRWLAFGGYFSDGTEGTYLLQPEDGRLTRISSAFLISPAWSPDGTAIAGIREPSDVGDFGDLVVLDVTQFVGVG